MPVTCEHCGKVFAGNEQLNRHQKSFKCVHVQQTNTLRRKENEIGELKAAIEEYKINIDSLKLEKEQLNTTNNCLAASLESSRSENLRLEKLLEKSMSRPTSTTVVHGTNQTTNKVTNGIENFMNMMQPITIDHLEDQAQFLQREHIEQGAEGYARYALEYPLKNRVVCTDFSRRKVQYKSDSGELIQDPEMNNLSQELFKAIRDRNETLINEYIGHVVKHNPSGGIVSSEIIMDLLKLKEEVSKLSQGEKSDLGPSIVKSICGKVTSANLTRQLKLTSDSG